MRGRVVRLSTTRPEDAGTIEPRLVRQMSNKKIKRASDETAAHDLLIVLLEREGSTTVLRTLQAWLMLHQLNRGALRHPTPDEKRATS